LGYGCGAMQLKLLFLVRFSETEANMKSTHHHFSKIGLIILFLFTGLFQQAQAQSVYVGQAGSHGKVLKQFIEPIALKNLTENPVDSIWIIDVRSEKAYAGGHIPTAKSFPVATIPNRLNEIPKDKYLIIYCTVGANAKIASKTLKKAGYKRYMNWGGISRWEWEKETASGLKPDQ
jgi:rhodanese-related sulfurtransferase